MRAVFCHNLVFGNMGGQFYCPVVLSLKATVVGYSGTAELGDGLGSLGNGVLGKLFDVER
jgi:hypothetical protein